MVATALTATPTKTRALIVDALAVRPRPADPITDDVLAALETVADVRGLAKARTRLNQAWSVEVEAPEPAAHELIDWVPVPEVWEVPRFDVGDVTLDALVDTARDLYARRDDPTLDVTVDKFLALATALAHTDADGLRSVLGGVKHSHSPGLGQIDPACECGSASCRQSSATALRTAREWSLFTRLGELPCLLSTPTWVDLRIDPADLLARLQQYRDAEVAVSEGDLLLAITRTDTALLDESILRQIEEVDVHVDRLRRPSLHAGELTADALRHPLVEPVPAPDQRRGLTTPGSVAKTPWLERFDVEIARTWYGDQNLEVFPTWSDQVVHLLDSVVRIAQAARRGIPFSSDFVRLLLTQCEAGVRESPEYFDALSAAFERGLLRPGPVSLFSGDYHPGRQAVARLLDELAHSGALAAAWSIIDAALADDATAPRVPSGTVDFVALAGRLLPSVQRAVETGSAAADVLHLPGLRAFAARRGSSIAVKDARALVAQLTDAPAPIPAPAVVEAVPALADKPFEA